MFHCRIYPGSLPVVGTLAVKRSYCHSDLFCGRFWGGSLGETGSIWMANSPIYCGWCLNPLMFPSLRRKSSRLVCFMAMYSSRTTRCMFRCRRGIFGPICKGCHVFEHPLKQRQHCKVVFFFTLTEEASQICIFSGEDNRNSTVDGRIPAPIGM